MEVFLGSFFLFILGVVLLLNIVMLPANWIMIGLVVLWRFLTPYDDGMGLCFFGLLIGLAVLGELVEYATQIWGSKKYGSSTSAMWAGVLGAVAGAFLGLPFLLGLGALIGALLGAGCASYLVERLNGRSDAEARKSAKGTLVGRFLGIVIKCGIGAMMIGLIWHSLFNSPAPFPLPATTF